MEDMQPGQVIIPHGPNDPEQPPTGAPEPERPNEQPEPTPVPAPQPETAVTASRVAVADPVVFAASDSAESPAQVGDAPDWQFRSESNHSAQPPLPDGLNWTASEFIAHEKNARWYGMLAAAGVVAVAVIYLLTKDKITTAILVFALIFFGVFASRKPRTQDYTLSPAGLKIGEKVYDFQDLKTFSIADEGSIVSIVFMPLKRFMPPLTIYVAPTMEDQVVDFLSAFLPFEQHKADAVDSLLRRIHF